MFTLTLPSAVLRSALIQSGRTREEFAEACDVTLRAVHRWLASEDLSAHRNMNPVLLSEILVWLNPPDAIQISLPRSLTGAREWRAALNRYDNLLCHYQAVAAMKTLYPSPSLRVEFIEAQVRLAWAKVSAIELFQGIDGVIPSVVTISGPESDPIFTATL
jgi:hypothetical protein